LSCWHLTFLYTDSESISVWFHTFHILYNVITPDMFYILLLFYWIYGTLTKNKFNTMQYYNPVTPRHVPKNGVLSYSLSNTAELAASSKYGVHWYFRRCFMTVDSSFLSYPVFPLFMPYLTSTLRSLLMCLGQEAMKPVCFSFVSGRWPTLLEIGITNRW
jgi:hypothetical protein